MLPVMILAMIVLMMLAVPVAVAIGLAGVIGTVGFSNLPLIVVPQQAFIALDKFPLAAIPFFILAGNVMAAGGISSRLVDLVESVLGNVRGGLPMSCIVVCMIFAAVSGSSVATTFAIGSILIPAMVRQKYPVGFAASLQATSAELGVIIPPSIPMILYGVSAGAPVGDLFIAGLGPGLLIAGALVIYVLMWTRLTGHGASENFPRKPFLPSLKRSGLALLMPIIILGGIYGGVFTPTEASVIAVFYALAVSLVIYREMTPRSLSDVIRRSTISSAIIMFIISMAGLFSFVLTRAGIPAAIGEWIVVNFDSAVAFLLAVNLFLFLIGMFIETSASIVVIAPILAPVAVRFGIDPVHFGMIMITNLAMGMITPPFGVNLFAACAVAKISLHRMIPHLVPLVGIIVVCLGLVTYFPSISFSFLYLLSAR
ncbi:C4-dicarboxylate ABC transporter permease [Mesorhizobium tianshanense]|uniref:TRAP transporter large permease protein n=1 Tax=Mesorhizobium tianshanense TaxID=39844 RepID=A0A562P1W7_9HYPH|nr:TRAP transporter large permease subunit [Mesorhizobium tianshanense]TWI38434.1 tripartite ATP-independent transporter DctM subunit [Mesorhizobium tianshanense]GLS38590.1 C4-dicarboxylate ABC transporter permease [Mesorhizobium tianshanense]